MKTKFFHINQNNSGGYFIENHEKGISEDVIIEAQDNDQAWEILSKVGDTVDGFWTSCSCCGDRWSSPWSDDGKDEPMIYGKSVYQKEESMFHKTAFIHRLDGTVERVDFKKSQSNN